MKLAFRLAMSIGVTLLVGGAVFAGTRSPTLLPDVSAAGKALAPATVPVGLVRGVDIGFGEPVVEVPEVGPPIDTPLVIDHPGSSIAADVTGSRIEVFDSPGAPAAERKLTNPTREGFPLVLLVKEIAGEWTRVQLPVRPNETFGWVRSSEIRTRNVPNHIVVEISKRKLSLFNGSELLMETPVGVGKARTPTPPGRFYVDISVKNPGGAYGRHMLSVAGFSNVLKTFGNGIGQVAIHGTNAPASVGQFSSNGCMRLSNDAVQRLAPLAPTGTPVFILP